MASKGSLGRSSHTEVQRKPALPTFNTKPRAKSDASKSETAKHKENATDTKHDKITEDSNSDPGASTHHSKGETNNKPEPPKADLKKSTGAKTIVIPSRYMQGSKPSPRTTPAVKPAAKIPTTSSGLRAKTPEKNAHSTTTERHAKTPTKQSGSGMQVI